MSRDVKSRVRVVLSRADDVDVLVDRENVALALIPTNAEVGATPDTWYRILVAEAWANGDGMEVVLQRVPKRKPDPPKRAAVDQVRLKALELLRVLTGPVPASYLRDTRERTLEVQIDNARVRALELVDLTEERGAVDPMPRRKAYEPSVGDFVLTVQAMAPRRVDLARPEDCRWGVRGEVVEGTGGPMPLSNVVQGCVPIYCVKHQADGTMAWYERHELVPCSERGRTR